MNKYMAKDLSIDMVIFMMGILAIFSIGVVALPFVDAQFLRKF